jgi:hypothetical protein
MPDEILNEDGQMNAEWKAKAEELIAKLATISREYPESVVMFVLEAALTEQIAMYSPMLGDMFAETMVQYRKRATLLLAVSDILGEKLGTVIDEASLNEALKGMKSELEAESTPEE